MTPDTINKRLFFCLLIAIILVGLCGCHSVKYEWLPENEHKHQKMPQDKTYQNVSKIEASIVKISF